MENREEERKLLDAAGVEGRVLSMKDGGQEVGYAIVDLQEGTLLLRKLAAKGYDFTQRPQGEELFILDTLMRSAASWGRTTAPTPSPPASRTFSAFSRPGASPWTRSTPSPP